MGARIVLVSALLASAARAGEDDRELAHRRLETGKLLYQRGQFAEALVEMQAAQRALDLREFDYNIGKCLEKLNRRAEAADALERFVRARPDDSEAANIWRSIAELRAPPTPTPPPTVASPPAWFRTTGGRVAVVLFGGGALLAVTSAITGGAALSMRREYDGGCLAGACVDATYQQARGLAIATDVMIGVGLVAVAAAIVVLATRSRAPERSSFAGLSGRF